MPFVSHTHRIAYFPVPKVACTSLKRAMYAIENGKDFNTAEFGGLTLQQSFPTKDFDPAWLNDLDGYWRYAVVRDPVKRVVSAYNNKIGNWSRQIAAALDNPKRRDRLLAAGIAPRPSLSEFAEKLEIYRRHFRPIRHHTDSFHVFLGPDLSRFDAIYRIEEMERLREDLSARIGQQVQFTRSNTSKRRDRNLTPKAVDALLAYTAPDYHLLSDFYQMPTPDRVSA